MSVDTENEAIRDNIKTLIAGKHYRNAVNDSGTLLEACMKEAYNILLLSIKSDEKIEIIKKEAEISGGRPINQLMLGELIRLFSECGLFKRYAEIKGKKLNYFKSESINQINEIRKKCTHDTYFSSENEAQFVFSSVCNISDELGFESKNIGGQTPKYNLVPQIDSLPRPEYTEFVGRENYIQEAIKQLVEGRSYIISIGGIGGVGKSALTLEIAKRCKENKLFDFILWVSAKKKRLAILGIEDITPQITSFEDMLNKFLGDLGFTEYEKYKVDEKKKKLYDLLKGTKALLVVDNFETIEDKEIFNFLKDLPVPAKALVTTRKAVGEVERIIVLEAFSQAETDKLLEVELSSRAYQQVKKEDAKKIHDATGGIPLAIKIIIGWLVQGESINSITEKIKKGDKTKILEFCFSETYDKLLSESAKTVFCTMSTIPFEWANRKQVEIASNISGDELDDALAQLVQLSLLNLKTIEAEPGISEDCYSMLPLTATYAYNRLTENRGMENDARRRFAKYMELNMQTQSALEQYGRAWGEMGGQTESGRASAMLANIAFATYQRGDYPGAIKLFKQSIETNSKLSYSYQLWATVERQAGNIKKAEQLFDNATKLNPKNPIMWSSWAMMKKEIGDLIGAKELLETGIKNVGSKPDLLQQLSVILSMMGRYRDAIEISISNLNQTPKTARDRFMNTLFMTSVAESYFKWGETLNKEKKYYEAASCFNEGIKQIGKYRSILFENNDKMITREKRLYRALGLSKRNNQKYSEAEELLNKAFYKSPTSSYQLEHNIMVSLDIAVLLKFRGEISKATQFCNECYNKYNDSRFLDLVKDKTSTNT